MTFETALRARLKAVPALAGIPVEWSRRKGYPSVVLTLVSGAVGRHMTGYDGQRSPRVQIDVFAMDAPTKVALREIVIDTIAASGLHGGVRFGRAQAVRFVDMSEETDTEFVFRDMIEAVMPHKLEN